MIYSSFIEASCLSWKSIDAILLYLLQEYATFPNDLGHHFEWAANLVSIAVEQRNLHMNWNDGYVVQVKYTRRTITIAWWQEIVLENVAIVKKLRMVRLQLMSMNCLNSCIVTLIFRNLVQTKIELLLLIDFNTFGSEVLLELWDLFLIAAKNIHAFKWGVILEQDLSWHRCWRDLTNQILYLIEAQFFFWNWFNLKNELLQ